MSADPSGVTGVWNVVVFVFFSQSSFRKVGGGTDVAPERQQSAVNPNSSVPMGGEPQNKQHQLAVNPKFRGTSWRRKFKPKNSGRESPRSSCQVCRNQKKHQQVTGRSQQEDARNLQISLTYIFCNNCLFAVFVPPSFCVFVARF